MRGKIKKRKRKNNTELSVGVSECLPLKPWIRGPGPVVAGVNICLLCSIPEMSPNSHPSALCISALICVLSPFTAFALWISALIRVL